ncbi:hypothetical protein [uncultured Pelagimonas sp.]|uniref:hypothetical protein n=1 Tax=uncultured Pelagimonas sp. TaxID=1618102 RepID=UPI0026246818|nr:hypothetical protein [uncultured Pelagimonas sp.]
MVTKTKLIPLAQYIAERTGVLSEEQIANYIEELSADEVVLEALRISADRTVSMSLAPQDQIDNALVASSHAVSYLRRNKLPDEGMQDLQQAQQRFVGTRLEQEKKNASNWFRRLFQRK